MSRRTKNDKDHSLVVLPHGQVIRQDTFDLMADNDRPEIRGARRFTPSSVVFDELDLDYTRKHREELRRGQQASDQEVSVP